MRVLTMLFLLLITVVSCAQASHLEDSNDEEGRANVPSTHDWFDRLHAHLDILTHMNLADYYPVRIEDKRKVFAAVSDYNLGYQGIVDHAISYAKCIEQTPGTIEEKISMSQCRDPVVLRTVEAIYLEKFVQAMMDRLDHLVILEGIDDSLQDALHLILHTVNLRCDNEEVVVDTMSKIRKQGGEANHWFGRIELGIENMGANSAPWGVHPEIIPWTTPVLPSRFNGTDTAGLNKIILRNIGMMERHVIAMIEYDRKSKQGNASSSTGWLSDKVDAMSGVMRLMGQAIRTLAKSLCTNTGEKPEKPDVELRGAKEGL